MTGPSTNRPTRVLLVCHYFPPEIGAPQARLSEMSATWAQDGAEVQVLTGFPNHPTGIIAEGYRGKRRMVEQRDGCEVIRTWLYATPNEGFVKKTLGHLSFMFSSILLGWSKVRKPDVIVVSSPTFFSIFSAWVLSKRFRVPMVVEVRDLWPGIFVELGVLTNKYLIWFLERLELAAYKAAAAVVVVTDGFRQDLLKRGVPDRKIEVITNGVDLEFLQPGPPDSATRARLGVTGDRQLVVYIGAHGISHGLASILEAARQLEDFAHFAFVGEGAQKAALVEKAAADGVTNVTFLPGVPRAQVPDIIHSADILLVPLRDIPLFETFIPSKMFEFLGAGGVVVGSVAGEAAEILRSAGATVVPPEQPTALAEAIRELGADPDRRKRQAVEGREYVEQHYDRRMLARRYLALLQRTVRS